MERPPKDYFNGILALREQQNRVRAYGRRGIEENRWMYERMADKQAECRQLGRDLRAALVELGQPSWCQKLWPSVCRPPHRQRRCPCDDFDQGQDTVDEDGRPIEQRPGGYFPPADRSRWPKLGLTWSSDYGRLAGTMPDYAKVARRFPYHQKHLIGYGWTGRDDTKQSSSPSG